MDFLKKHVFRELLGLPWWLSQSVTNLPAAQQSRVRSLGREDPQETATHSSILAWKIPWTERPGGLQFMESERVRFAHDPRVGNGQRQ